jgi:hypothetical protein
MDESSQRAARVEEAAGRVERPVFRGDDPECMVAAGLACRACLSSDVDWSLVAEPWDARVVCRCRRCEHERTLSLTPDQALRLSLRRDRDQRPAAPEPHAGLALLV